jgi:SAM-dependent methyltransferase
MCIRDSQSGLAVEGVDSSADMLAVCRQKAEAEGLSPVLYCQPMQALDLPKRYDCIYVPCGSWTCVMGRDNAMAALRRFLEHLRPGGVLAFNVYWDDWGDYDYSNPKKERVYPGEWMPHVVKELGGERRLVVDRRLTGVDPVDQLTCEERRYRLMDGETLLQEEVHAGQNHWYFKAEVEMMLKVAGFVDIEVTGDYTGEAFGPQHTGTIVFVCRKPQT